MATEKKQSFLGGAAVLAFGIVAVKIIGAVFKIPLRNILGEGGSADFSNAYNIYATLLTISTAGLPVEEPPRIALTFDLSLIHI